jgi:signal transduction histidine kinase
MRFTVSTKIILGLAVVLTAGTLSMLFIYRGLNALQKGIHELADVKEPISAAAYEMEVNVNGIGLGVLKFMDTLDPTYRTLVEKDEADFERFHAKYFQLARTSAEQQLGARIGSLYKEFSSLGRALMRIRVEQEALFTAIGAHFEGIDDIIDNKIQPQVDRDGQDGFKKVEAVNDLEADLAEVAFWLASYQRSHKPEHRQFVVRNEKEFRERLLWFKSLELSQEERWLAGIIEWMFNQVMASTHKILAFEDRLQKQIRQFVQMRLAIDALLDEEIQPLALAALITPRKAADQETEYVIRNVLFLIPLFVGSVIVVAFLLIRAITGPVTTLMAGTEAIRAGDLSHRVGPLSRDELGDLADNFNSMVAQLEATTVSKKLLQASEAKLQETVVELRREIAERERAEQERAQLESSLRRNEMMAVMGSLVAGVAHEVRNPLFAISSTLDAFENRFADRGEYQRYLGVLRAEANRLTGLMQALLEYGKPTSQEFVQDSIADVLRQAVRSYGPLAEELNVKISEPDSGDRRLIRMDRERLLQVFQNLIENAVQHSPPGGSVVIEIAEVCEEGQSWISCEIKDSGPGFPQGYLAKIFEPFFTRRRGGTGLGLSIVQRIVEEHGGQIAADNRPEGGAVITVRFPLVQQTVLERGDQEVQRGTEQDLNS